jgi:hypothetical protein
MRIPNNIIVKNQYTIGNEFVDPTTNISYQGYYYELNGSFFQGKEFNPSSPKLIRKANENILLNNPLTATFSKVSGITSQQLQPPLITSAPLGVSLDYFYGVNFFVKQLNIDPPLIKKIDEETYRSLKASSPPLYQVIFIGTFENRTLSTEEANQQMPGLKDYLSG